MKSSMRQQVVNGLSAARFQPFLNEAHGNYKYALSLYRWHMELSSAVSDVLGLTEIVLRNSIDRQLQIWNSNDAQGSEDWLLGNVARPLDSLTRSKRVEALRRASKDRNSRPVGHPRYGLPLTHNDVLAHTMFGMWKDLLPNHACNANLSRSSNEGRRILWEEAIRYAFPYADDHDGATTYWHTEHCHKLRNRVAHMDSLLNVNVTVESRRAFTLVNSIDPQIGSWLSSVSQVSAIYSQRP